ncbi:MAG: glycosyl hydrolase family 8 [Sphingomonas fennica]
MKIGSHRAFPMHMPTPLPAAGAHRMIAGDDGHGMTIDRRTMTLGLLGSLLGACARAAGGQPQEAAAPPTWDDWKRRFLTKDGRVVDTGNGGISHSEGQGYGLILAEAAGDRRAFEQIWRWTETVLARRDARLFSWRFDATATPAVSDVNNATDGDLLIAWGLMRAARRWRVAKWEAASRAIRIAIASELVAAIQGRIVLLPGFQGFVSDKRTQLNPSYYVWPALDAFRAADPEGPWGDVIADGEALLAEARFGANRLPTDWIDLDPQAGVRPAEGRPARFGYDAVRVPLYLAWSGRQAPLAPFRAWWATPANRVAWVDVLSGERASEPLSAGGTAVAGLALGQALAVPAGPMDYYTMTLALLAAAARREMR